MQRLARGLLGGDGDDVAQEAMVRAWAAAPPERGSVRGWLAAIVGNLAHNHRRSARRRQACEGRAAAVSVPAVGAIDAREEVRGRVVAAVLELPPALRDVVLSPDIVEAWFIAMGSPRTQLPSTPVFVGVSFFHQMLSLEVDAQLNLVAVTATNALQPTAGQLSK